MVSLFQIVLVVLAATSAMADPARFRQNSRGSRFFARQEVPPSAAPAPVAPFPEDAPYPAAGITPSVPFELPNEQTTVQPDNTYLPPAPAPTPDNTYGPPQETYGPPAPPQPDNQYGPPEAPLAQPDNQYGPPAPPAAEEQTLDVDPRSQRIIVRQRNQKLSKLSQQRQQRIRSQPLRAARIQFEPVEIIRSRPVVHYSVQYKSF